MKNLYGLEIDNLYDQSFSDRNFRRLIVKSDFRKISAANVELYREQSIANAIAASDELFQARNPLVKFHVNGKDAYRPGSFVEDLVIRKISKNLDALMLQRPGGRDFITKNLLSLLREGVPYRVYRLDIRKFYPSVSHDSIMQEVSNSTRLSHQTVKLIQNLLSHYTAMGGSGVPLGLQISAPLTELLMRNFDLAVQRFPGTYFYARYVDDIVAITKPDTSESEFVENLTAALPPGLLLHDGFKRSVLTISGKVSPKSGSRVRLGRLSFLGYEFSVFEPLKKRQTRDSEMYRDVEVSISHEKIKKMGLPQIVWVT